MKRSCEGVPMRWWMLDRLAAFLGILPRRWVMALGRFMGCVGYHLASRQRHKVILNLKTAFAGRMAYDLINRTAKRCFEQHMINTLDFIHLTANEIDRLQQFVHFKGLDTLEKALDRHASVILTAMHHGPWELGSLASALKGYPYFVMIRDQPHWGLVGAWFDHRRKRWGVQTIHRGQSLKQLIRILRQGGILALVADQGGKKGVDVPFFGRTARFARGAVWLALREKKPLMFVTVHREPDATMLLQFKTVWEPHGSATSDEESLLRRLVREMEKVVANHPEQYFWFYKVWKYSAQRTILVLHDGKKGHQHQAQTAASWLCDAVDQKGWQVTAVKEVGLVFRSGWRKNLFLFISALLWRWAAPGRVGWMRAFLTRDCFNEVMSLRADYVVSAATTAASVAALVSRDHGAKSLQIFKSGWVPQAAWTAMVMPRHDMSSSFPSSQTEKKIFVTHGALHSLTPECLENQKQLLLKRYSHYRPRGRVIIGVLIGGPTSVHQFDKTVTQRMLRSLQQAAEELGADVVLTTSRRTPPAVEQRIRSLRKETKHGALFISGRDPVPEAVGGILGLSDIVVVTADSISMVCEAAGSGKPVVVMNLPKKSRGQTKHDRFLEHMLEEGFIMTADQTTLGRVVMDCIKRKRTTKRLNEKQAFLSWAKHWI